MANSSEILCKKIKDVKKLVVDQNYSIPLGFLDWMKNTFSSTSEEDLQLQEGSKKKKIRFITSPEGEQIGYYTLRKKIFDQHLLGNSKEENGVASSVTTPSFHVQVQEIVTFPDFKINDNSEEQKKTVLRKLRRDLKENQDLVSKKLYRIILPGKALDDEVGERKAKKRKREESSRGVKKEEVHDFAPEERQQSSTCNTEHPSVTGKGRAYTVSIALPGSILDNAQSPQLRSYLAGQIARALVIFNVDEVVIFNEGGPSNVDEGEFKGSTKATDPNILLARILQYLECPQYLRKYLFQRHPDLQFAGLLNPLDSPHHMRTDDEMPFREGVVLDRPVKPGKGSYVNVGTRREIIVDRKLKPGIRVTVEIDTQESDQRNFTGRIVSPSTPRTEQGLYWGYTVRLAPTFGAVFTQCSFPDGYDLTIGTSERGLPVEKTEIDTFKHCLIVFGGLRGLEASLESDETLQESDPALLFDHYVNSCINQGSRTIRTEEAILITMSALRSKLDKVIPP